MVPFVYKQQKQNAIILEEENLKLKKELALLEKESERSRLNFTHTEASFLL